MSALPQPLVDLLASVTARSETAPYLRATGVVLTDGAWVTKGDRKHWRIEGQHNAPFSDPAPPSPQQRVVAASLVTLSALRRRGTSTCAAVSSRLEIYPRRMPAAWVQAGAVS